MPGNHPPIHSFAPLKTLEEFWNNVTHANLDTTFSFEGGS